MIDQDAPHSTPAGSTARVTLPVEHDVLADFLGKLLGQQQRISRSFSGLLDVDLDWLCDLHTILDQRIFRQHNASLVQFSATINFHDGYSRTINSVDALKTFNEIRNSHSVSCTLEWTFLVDFPDRHSPERQDIRIDISDCSDPENITDRTSSGTNFGKIDLEIHCSERSWADDIERLLSSHFENKIVPISKIKHFFVEYRSLLTQGMTGLMLLSLVSSLYFFVEIRNSLEIMQALEQAVGSKKSQISLSDKVGILLELEKLRLEGKSHVYLPLGLVVYFVLFLSVTFYSSNVRPSFVVCTTYSGERRNRTLRSYRTKNSILVSIITSLVAGIVILFGSYVYSLL